MARGHSSGPSSPHFDRCRRFFADGCCCRRHLRPTFPLHPVLSVPLQLAASSPSVPPPRPASPPSSIRSEHSQHLVKAHSQPSVGALGPWRPAHGRDRSTGRPDQRQTAPHDSIIYASIGGAARRAGFGRSFFARAKAPVPWRGPVIHGSAPPLYTAPCRLLRQLAANSFVTVNQLHP